MVRIVAETIERRSVDSLVPYARNSRTHSEDQVAQLAAAMREFGFTNPVLIDENGGIIAGHGRIMAARAVGLSEVPCITLSGLTDAQRRAYVIADNKIALNAGWNDEVLREEMRALADADYDLDLTGFDDDDLAELFNDDDQGKDGVDEQPLTAVQKTPFSKPGDVWIMGNHRLICGDSTVATTYAPLLGGGLADMVFTDPPYGVDYADVVDARVRAGIGKHHKPIANDARSDEDQAAFWLAAFTQLAAAIKPGAAYYVASPQGGRMMMMMMQAMTSAGIPQRHEIIWRKSTFVLGRSDYHYQHEPILYGWREGGAHAFYGGRSQTSVWDFDKPQRADLHPTMKPVELVQKAIANSSKSGDIVLDIFGGSGTTLIACESSGRHCRMIELDDGYIDVIVRRWQSLTGETARRECDGATMPELEAVAA